MEKKDMEFRKLLSGVRKKYAQYRLAKETVRDWKHEYEEFRHQTFVISVGMVFLRQNFQRKWQGIAGV